MKGLSRSEIENSVKRSAKAEPRVFETETPESSSFNPRNPVVLGGDLTGVRSTPKYNDYKWMLVAASIFVLSILVFIVPELFKDTPKLKKVQHIEVSKDSVYKENSLLEKKNDSSDLTKDVFTQSSDRDRAQEYRETDLVQEKIVELKKLTESALQAGKYTKPEGESAYYYYQEILKLDDDNRFAERGLSYLARRLLSVGLNEINNGELSKAKNSLASLMLFGKDSESFTELSDAVAKLETEKQNEIQQQEDIENLLLKAEDAFERQRLTTPEKTSALTYYQSVLEFDPENEAAQQGVQKVITYYSDAAIERIEQNNLLSAEENIKKIRSINEDALEIETLEKLLERSKEINDEKQRELEQAQEEEVRRAAQLRLEKELEEEKLAQKSPIQEQSIINKDIQKSESFKLGAPVEDITNTSRANLTTNNSALKSGLQSYYNNEYTGAFKTLKPLADSNNTRAQIRVAYMYQFGRGIQENKTSASQYFNKALPNLRDFANQGQAWAQTDLGSLYEDGISVTQSYQEALEWYRKAATKNDTGAQTNLGNMYFFGKGVEQSQEEAIRWYRLAAIGGSVIAKENLNQLGVASL